VSSGLDGLDVIADAVVELGIEPLVNVADLDGSVWARFGVLNQPAMRLVTADGQVVEYHDVVTADGLAAFVAEHPTTRHGSPAGRPALYPRRPCARRPPSSPSA